jgi:hypothetical protein
MRSILFGLALAMVAAGILGPAPASAQPDGFPITVNANGAAAVDVTVVLNFANKGKQPLGMTGAGGNFVLDLANLPKVRVEVTIEDCPNGMQIVFNEPGAMPEDGCNRRVVGFWIWGNGTNLVIDTGAGTLQVFGDTFFTPRNIGLIGGGGAAAVIIGVTAGGNGSSGTSGTSSGGGTTTPGSGGTTPPSGGGGTTPPSTTPADFNSEGTGSLPVQTNQCGFSNTANISFRLNVDANGTGTWTKIHTLQGITFSFPVTLTVQNSTTANFTSTITNQPVGQLYQVSDQVTVTRNGTSRTLNIRQEFRNNGNGCLVVYQGTVNGAQLP